MLAKLTAKNQITLPKAALSKLPHVEYFEVTVDDGRIVLTPARLNRADAVREKLAALGIRESDLDDAIGWARGKR